MGFSKGLSVFVTFCFILCTSLTTAYSQSMTRDEFLQTESFQAAQDFHLDYAIFLEAVFGFVSSSSNSILKIRGPEAVREFAALSILSQPNDIWNEIDKSIEAIKAESLPAMKELRLSLFYKYLKSRFDTGFFDEISQEQINRVFQWRTDVNLTQTGVAIPELDLRIDMKGPAFSEEDVLKFYRALLLNHLTGATSLQDLLNRSSVPLVGSDLWKSELGFFNQIFGEAYSEFRDRAPIRSVESFAESRAAVDSFFAKHRKTLSPEIQFQMAIDLTKQGLALAESFLKKEGTGTTPSLNKSNEAQQIFQGILDVLRIGRIYEIPADIRSTLRRLFYFGLKSNDKESTVAWMSFQIPTNPFLGDIFMEPELEQMLQEFRIELGLEWIRNHADQLLNRDLSFEALSQVFGILLPLEEHERFKELREKAKQDQKRSALGRLTEILLDFDLSPKFRQAFRAYIVAAEKAALKMNVNEALDFLYHDNSPYLLGEALKSRMQAYVAKQMHEHLEAQATPGEAESERISRLEAGVRNISAGRESFEVRLGPSRFTGCYRALHALTNF